MSFRGAEAAEKYSSIAISPSIVAHSYFSVDIFDTLLFRLCRTPVEVFRFMQQRSEVSVTTKHFKDYRIAAEEQARKDSRKRDAEDVSLAEIYTCFQEFTSCTREQAEIVRRIELETEMALLQPTNFGKRFLEHVQKTGKRFVLTSDMYLPSEFLTEVLTSKGIFGWERLFVSNEHGRMKRTGTLYRDVIDHFNVPAEKILHIGDNRHADGKMAISAGLKSHLVFASKDLTKRSRIAGKQSHIFNGQLPLSQIFAAQYLETHHFEADKLDFAKLSDDAYFEALGAVLIAPVILSMMIWLKSEMDKRDLRRIAFLARGGMFPKAVYDILWPKEYETHYVAASRRLLTLPFTKLDEPTVRGMFRSTLDRCNSIDEFFERIAAGEILTELFDRTEFSASGALNRRSRKKILQVLQDNPDTIYRSFGHERDAIALYYKSIFPAESRTAVFDVGWRGSLQRSMCEIIDQGTEVTGFYFGTRRDAATILGRNGLDYASFSVSNGLPAAKESWSSDFLDVIEFLFSANHGSVLGITNEGSSGFKWQMADVTELERANLNIAAKIQQAALHAITAVNQAVPVASLQRHLTSDDEGDLYDFLARPHRNDARRFRNVRALNGVGDTIGESLTRIGGKKSHYHNVKNSRWRAAYGAQLNGFSRLLVNFRLRKRKYRKFQV